MQPYNRGEEVLIPTSKLGEEHGIGKVIACWAGRIAVDFSGHLGHYEISKHTIIRAPLNVENEELPNGTN